MQQWHDSDAGQLKNLQQDIKGLRLQKKLLDEDQVVQQQVVLQMQLGLTGLIAKDSNAFLK